MELAELQKAIEYAGTQEALATLINRAIIKTQSPAKPIRQANISMWINRDKRIGKGYAALCEIACSNQVSAMKLRPDLYPIVLDSGCDVASEVASE